MHRKRRACPVCWRGISVSVGGRFRSHSDPGSREYSCRASGRTAADMECWARYTPLVPLPSTLSGEGALLLRQAHQAIASGRGSVLAFRDGRGTRELHELGLITIAEWGDGVVERMVEVSLKMGVDAPR